jgi:hypothetical protein
MAANDWFCQFLADVIAAPIQRPLGVETAVFTPTLPADGQAERIAGWRTAIRPTLAKCRVRTAPISDPLRPKSDRHVALRQRWPKFAGLVFGREPEQYRAACMP